MRDPHRYHFPTGGAFIAGFAGWAGKDIYMMGVIFWKPISGIAYEEMEYPTLGSLTRLNSPDSVDSRTYCNNASSNKTFAIEQENFSFEVGTTSCMESTMTTQFSTSVTLKGGIPAIKSIEASASIEAKWEAGFKVNRENCATITKTVTKFVAYPVYIAEPKTSVRFLWSQWAGRLSALPFTALVRITFNDRSSYTRRESGTYKGVSFTDATQSWVDERENINGC